MPRSSRNALSALAACAALLLAATSARALTLSVDPAASTLQLAGERAAPLGGRLEVTPIPCCIGEAPYPPDLFALQGILLEGAGRTLSGPDAIEFMGLTPQIVPLPGFSVGDQPYFFAHTNLEILAVEGERVLIRSWDLIGEEVTGAYADGALVALAAELELVEVVQWWRKVPEGPAIVCPPGLVCPSLPAHLNLNEVVSRETIAEVSLRAAAVPEPHGLLLFGVGLALVEWRRRRGA
jgi:hypothetical protein